MYLHRVARGEPVPVGGEPVLGLRGPALPEPAQPAAELGHEVPQRPAAPVARVEELALEQAEEPLGPGVVAARALARHAAGQAVPADGATQPGQL